LSFIFVHPVLAYVGQAYAETKNR